MHTNKRLIIENAKYRNKMKRLTFLLWLLIEVFTLSTAKEGYSFLNIGLREGLSNEFVNDMVMDEQGFLWVATESGLNRIAGNKCTISRPATQISEKIRSSIYVTTKEATPCGCSSKTER